jgi:hypothetical protein
MLREDRIEKTLPSMVTKPETIAATTAGPIRSFTFIVISGLGTRTRPTRRFELIQPQAVETRKLCQGQVTPLKYDRAEVGRVPRWGRHFTINEALRSSALA